jgi:hypothetical protein
MLVYADDVIPRGENAPDNNPLFPQCKFGEKATIYSTLLTIFYVLFIQCVLYFYINRAKGTC